MLHSPSYARSGQVTHRIHGVGSVFGVRPEEPDHARPVLAELAAKEAVGDADLHQDVDEVEHLAEHVQSLLKVAIHGGGGATRPGQGRAVQFEGHWIARPNPGRQRAGGAAGAGAE